jgi:hypothetical protein
LKRADGVAWTGLVWLREGPQDSSCECGNKLLGSIKYWEVLSGCTSSGLSSSFLIYKVNYWSYWQVSKNEGKLFIYCILHDPQ